MVKFRCIVNLDINGIEQRLLGYLLNTTPELKTVVKIVREFGIPESTLRYYLDKWIDLGVVQKVHYARSIFGFSISYSITRANHDYVGQLLQECKI